MILIFEIALGIVLAVLVLRHLDAILSVGMIVIGICLCFGIAIAIFGGLYYLISTSKISNEDIGNIFAGGILVILALLWAFALVREGKGIAPIRAVRRFYDWLVANPSPKASRPNDPNNEPPSPR